MQLNTDDLIDLAKNGKINGVFWDEVSQAKRDDVVELDAMAKEVFSECAYMMKFERDCYLKGKKKNGR